MAIFDARYRTVTESYEDVNIDDILPDVDTSNVPDNFDEAVSGILYSNERNWNMLMQTVGIAELSCMEAEGDVIYEAADIKAFFKKIGDFFKTVLDKIAAFFRKIVEKVQDWFFSIKKKMNEKKFKDLAQVPANFKYEGYNFIDNLDKFVLKTDAVSNWADSQSKEITGNIRALFFNSVMGTSLNTGKDENIDLAKEIFKYFRNDKDKPEEITSIDISEYKNIINTSVTSVKRSVAVDFKALQADTNNTIKKTKDLMKTTQKEKNSVAADADNAFPGLGEVTRGVADEVIKRGNEYISCCKSCLDVATQIYSGQLKALHDRSKQYYGALVKMLSSKSSSEEKKDDKKEGESQTESFGFSHSILDNVSFI